MVFLLTQPPTGQPTTTTTTTTAVFIFLTLTLTCDLVTCFPFLHGPLSTHDGSRLEKVADDLSSRLTDLTTHLQSQGVQITDLGTQLAKVTQSVSFTVTFASRDVQGLGQLQTLRFDKILFNAGNGYDARTGFFTAPRPGLYAFDIRVTRHPGDPERCLEVDLIHGFKKQSPSAHPRQQKQQPSSVVSSKQQQFLSALTKQQQQQNRSAMFRQQKSSLDNQKQLQSSLDSQKPEQSSLGKQQQEQSSLDNKQQHQSSSDSQHQLQSSSNSQHQQQSSSTVSYQQQQVATTSACIHGDRSASNRAVLYLAQGDTVHAQVRSGTMVLGDVFSSMSGIKLADPTLVLSSLIR